MASNIISRLLPTLEDDNANKNRPARDVEGNAGLDIDEMNLDARFQDTDLEQLLAEAAEEDDHLGQRKRSEPDRKTRERYTDISPAPQQRHALAIVDEDDDVPESLLLDRKPERRRRRRSQRSTDRGPEQMSDETAIPTPGPATLNTRAQWEATKAQQRLHENFPPTQPPPPQSSSRAPQGRGRGMATPFILDPKDRAMWIWTNVENLDVFLKEVYYYYEHHGIWSICLERLFGVLTAAFVVGFTTYVSYCIHWDAVWGHQGPNPGNVQVDKCLQQLPFLWNFLLFVFAVFQIVNVLTCIRDIPRLWDMHNFYHHLLDIPDHDIQTVSWQYVVSRLMALRDANPTTALNLTPANRRYLDGQSKQRMDAHDIANRLMRRENYWIAIINKDILDSSVNIPFLGKTKFYTNTIEFNIAFCVMDYVFDSRGHINPKFLNSKYRKELVTIIKKRFFAAGVINIFLGPVLVLWALAVHFFGFFAEYQKNPSALALRSFTRLAEWKFREFNEVTHLFERRKVMAYPYASRYLDQFPKDKLTQLYKFIAFVMSALASVLAIVTWWDNELLTFEIGGKGLFFWLALFLAIYWAARNAAPEEDMVLDPEFALNNVIECTHYCPASWQGRLHSEEVRREFSSLYQPRTLLFLEEAASMILAPIILMYSLPNCADRLVDFFREFTVHVDGLGHVCSFAVFDFKRGGEPVPRPGARAGDLRDDYYAAKDNKLLESYYSFLDHYGPNPKRGLQTRHAKRPFHPPPTFPGLAGSPSLMAEVQPQGRHAASALRQSTQHTPRFAPIAGSTGVGHTSPMHSILLDPHHQPRIIASRYRGGVTTANGVARSGLVTAATVDDPAEIDEGLEGARGDQTQDATGTARQTTQRTGSGLMDEDSDLGDSWHLKGGIGSGDAAASQRRDLQASGDDKGVGVLGILYHQLRKGRPEGETF